MRRENEQAGRASRLARPFRSPVANALLLVLVACVCVFVTVWLRRRERPASPPEVALADEPRTTGAPDQPLVSRPHTAAPPRAPAAATLPVEDEHEALTDILGCWDRKACPAGTVCWMADDGHLGCFAPNCQSVADREKKCGAGQACLPASKMASIYRCVAAGPLTLGGSCLDPMIATPSRTCQPGLICVNTLCRAACDPAQPDCAANEVCAQQTTRDWACMPGCASDGDCDGGKACLRRNAARGTCVSVPPGTCRPDRPDSCPQGETCDANVVDGRMLAGFCRRSCDAGVCPAGFACWPGMDARPAATTGGICLQTCRADGQGCPTDQVCMALDAESTRWGCRRDFHNARPALDVRVARGSFGDAIAKPL